MDTKELCCADSDRLEHADLAALLDLAPQNGLDRVKRGGSRGARDRDELGVFAVGTDVGRRPLGASGHFCRNQARRTAVASCRPTTSESRDWGEPSNPTMKC